MMKQVLLVGVCLLALASAAQAADLSPATWPQAARESAEKTQAERWDPEASRSASGSGGVISATVSPIAVEAGLQALKQGGTAADAAATVALTQISTQLGSVVSYAGIMTLLYYDAKTGKVYSLDGGYNSYRGETDPKSIPVSDLGALNFGRTPTIGGAKGRETLVPGFMAGIQAMHDKFGKLPFDTLFQPAIWYAEHGVTISPHLAKYFQIRQPFLSKSPEGQAFLHQAGNDLPQPGDNFLQPELAKTLHDVAAHGAGVMYTGAWGKAFVAAVQKAGGKVTTADLADYRPHWNEPYADQVFGHTVYVNGAPNLSVYQVVTGLNLAEALKLDQRGPYWSDATTFRDLARISDFVSAAPHFDKATADLLHAKGIDISEAAQRKKAFATATAPLLDQLFTTGAGADDHHSNSIVVVDEDGDIAVMTHTINAVIWGDTGIVVGGIPLPDSAGFQQERLAQIKPGDRVPNEIAVTLTFDGKKPVLATAPIGSALVPETIKLILGVIGQKQDLASVVAAPALLSNPGDAAKALSDRTVMVPADAYGAEFLDQVKAQGIRLQTVPAEMARGLRGTLATAAIDPKTGAASSPEVPGVMIFAGAE